MTHADVPRRRYDLDESLPPDVVASAPGMRALFVLAKRAATTDATILVSGETGTGKAMIARWIHLWSPRRDGPLIHVDCAGVPDAALQAELFGPADAAGMRPASGGRFADAARGTILLGDVGEMPPATQASFVRLLQTREALRAADPDAQPGDARIVAATQHETGTGSVANRLRPDLYHRLAALTLVMPPLRTRREDVVALVPAFAARFAAECGVPVPRVTRAALDLLLSYEWPGNVRELRNVMQRAVLAAHDGVIRPEELRSSLLRPGTASAAAAGPAAPPRAREDADSGTLDDAAFDTTDRPMPEVIDAVERRMILRALAAHGGVKSRAARSLGIHERVLRYKIEKLGIGAPPAASGAPRRTGPGDAADSAPRV